VEIWIWQPYALLEQNPEHAHQASIPIFVRLACLPLAGNGHSNTSLSWDYALVVVLFPMIIAPVWYFPRIQHLEVDAASAVEIDENPPLLRDERPVAFERDSELASV